MHCHFCLVVWVCVCAHSSVAVHIFDMAFVEARPTLAAQLSRFRRKYRHLNSSGIRQPVHQPQQELRLDFTGSSFQRNVFSALCLAMNVSWIGDMFAPTKCSGQLGAVHIKATYYTKVLDPTVPTVTNTEVLARARIAPLSRYITAYQEA